ncbi:chemotaxis protein CheW [Oceanobacillus indicireducens]|uniref:Chemotaxis protein CheW n=1 Tax=Oceanobacillus indicireducens TaxID=1004261 RepID=A0A918D0A7_9BACI|nr:chemotaxis protein CheW [Oceanobacillus indicireducens]GGN53515.1 chemotaxis protein CheW [Oceanobacillus indicireducens]
MEESRKYILFSLNGQAYAVDAQYVISIERLQQITEVPQTKEFIRGVTEIRDETTAIIDLRIALSLMSTENTNDTRILVVTLEGMQIGLIVDAVTEVLDINSNNIEDAPSIISGVQATYLEGVAKVNEQLILLLDIAKTLDMEDKEGIKEVLQ